MIPRKVKQKKNLSDMDQSSDKPKEMAGASSKTDAAFTQETFSEGVLTRNRTSSITKSSTVPRPRTRSLSGSSQSDILTPESDKQSPGPGSMVKRTSVPAKPDQLVNENLAKGRRRRRTKAQIAADNAAKEALLELEKKETGLPITKKPGRPRGRPKKVRTPVETPSSTVTNSPTPSLHNEEPLPSVSTSNQESLESPTGDQETTKSSNESNYDFDAEQPSIDNATTLPLTVSMTLLKKEELTFNVDTPLLKEDTTPSPVSETKTPHSCGDKDVMVVVEEQLKEEFEKGTAKTTEQPSMPVEMAEQQDVPEDSLSQTVVCPDNISTEDTVDGDPTEETTEKPTEQVMEKHAEEPIESMDISPCKAIPTEVPSEKAVQSSSAGTPAPESVITADHEKISSNFPTDNEEVMEAGSTAITSTVEGASIQICSTGCTTTTLTNAECTFADSFLTTCAVTAVTNTNTNSAISVTPSNASPSGTTDTLKSSIKTVLSAAPVVSLSTSSSAASIGKTAISNSTTKATTTSVSVDGPSSSSCTAVNSIATTITPSIVSLGLSSASMKNNNAKTVVSSSVSSTSTAASTTTASTTTASNNNTNGVAVSSTGAIAVSSDSIKSAAPSVVSLKESSSGATEMSSAARSVTSLSTSLSVSTPSSAVQSMSSVIPSRLLNTSTTAIGTTTVGNALSKISSQALLHSLTTTVNSTSVPSVAKPIVTSASTDTTRDVAKLDPLPINLNTSLCVTLPTLSSLLTTPSGHQKLVLPLEKLILPSNLETSAATTGSFISPPVSKPSHSCSYVITSMQMKDTDPVSLAVSTMAQITKENSLHSTGSQKVTSTLHGPISSSMPLIESKKTEAINVETKLREIAPKTLGLEFHHLTSDISRSSGMKKPELYEVLSNFKVAAVNRSLGSSESKPSSFGTSTVASIIGQSSGKEKLFDQSGSGQVEQQHKPRPIAIKPDGMDSILRQIPAAVATSSRTYPTVHPLFPLPPTNKTANLMSSFDLFRNVPTTQKQYSAAPNISASVLPHLPGSSIAAYPTQKAPPPLISITDGPSQTVLGSVRVKVIDAPASAHQSSLSSLPAHMKVTRPRPLASQQSSVSAPVVTTSLVSVTGSVPAPPITYSSVSQQQYIPHPLTIGVHASSSNKAPSTADVLGACATASQPTSTTAVASVTKVKSEYEPAVTSHIPVTSSVVDFKTSLECPMCRHPVKNYKALCGHMKMHGGWDKSKFSSLDDYVCLYRSSMAAKAHAQAQAQESAAQKRAHSAVATSSSASDGALQPPPSKRHEGDPPQVFTFENNSKMSQESLERRFINHSAATLDDLCKAAESMRKMGASAANQPDYLKRRPDNIVIPSQYYASGSGNPPGGDGHQRSPPYTPPPLLSPRPSIFTNTPLTPRSLYWPQRRSSEAPTVSESEESMTYSEPKINVGEEYQAELGDCDETKQGVDQDNDFSELVFKPLDNLSRDDEDILDGYFELACSPAVRLGGRNKEYAHHILHKLGGSVKEAVRVLLSGRSLVHKDSFMASYNYSGATKWSTKERQRFRRAWRDNHKDFRSIQKIVSSKNMRNVIEYYYTWKKYCMDEYKGRSRHYSMEEELSEDELETINGLTYDSYADRPAARASSDHHSYGEAGHSFTHPQIQSVLLTSSNSTKPSSDTSPRPDKPTFKCTYPGCTAAYSSIFALNGHIRIHGGSFYPPRGEKKEQVKTEEHLDGSGVPRDADAKSPRNQGARSGSSPKRGQTGGFSSKAVAGATSKAHKGKRISTTPHDQDGHYPCRLCGRVFDKVKSRSAHMKSHVVKPGGK